MNKKEEPRTEVIRITKSCLLDLKAIHRIMNMSTRQKDGHVVAQLCKLFKEQKIDPRFLQKTPGDHEVVWSHQSSLDDYKFLYDEQCDNTRKWMKRFEIACEKGGLNTLDVIPLVK